MTTYIYFDQNTLSDLRKRKRESLKSAHLDRLHSELVGRSNHDIRVLYSATHLDEIRQIDNQEYIEEHIQLLCELEALYIEPLTTELNAKSPKLVWKSYLMNEKENAPNGVNKSTEIVDQLLRKLSGLEVGSDFSQIHQKLLDSASTNVADIKKLLSELSPEELNSHHGQQMSLKYKQLFKQAELLAKSSPINITEEEKLGPKGFRKHNAVFELHLNELKQHDVIPAIDKLFASANGDYSYEDYFDNSIHNQISRYYTLMNWVGYHPDDFTKVKSGRDRFKASFNDLKHASSSVGASYLVSNDNAFIKKARACYAHLSVPTQVLSLEEAIEELNL
ncbi:hypothetical protein [Thiomicrospira pelophila]|uniref:hypothetical protein n=1 Tax=Thiomicrospira pelophila TaxID=934 RepID=UPI0004A7023C|nr:hypothetical protein [Thiomicrospira pelophila]